MATKKNKRGEHSTVVRVVCFIAALGMIAMFAAGAFAAF
jgi:hypothetical protein